MPSPSGVKRRPSFLVLSLFAAGLVGACTGVGGARTDDANPTASPAADNAGIGHATGPTDVVLRAEQAGGFTPPEFQITRVPEITVYGDGTVLYQVPSDPNDLAPSGPPRLAKATLDDEQMASLLAFAIGAGGLGAAKEQYINPLVADAPETVFTIATDEVTKRVSVQALGLADDPTNPDAAQLAALQSLYSTLVPFADQVARGNATDAGMYEPTAYRAAIFEQAGQVGGELLDWPWTDVSLDDFVGAPGAFARTAVLTSEQAKALSATPEGGLFNVAVMGPDRVPYSIALRPLLPDEAE